MKLRLLNWLLDGPIRKYLEGRRIRLDPWGTWLYSSCLDTTPMGDTEGAETRELGVDQERANLLASLIPDDECGRHVLILDIDHPARLVPSTTKGRFHLYVNKPIPWHKLAGGINPDDTFWPTIHQGVLPALADAGVIHRNYAKHTASRGYTNVRPPWVSKKKDTPLHCGSDAA